MMVHAFAGVLRLRHSRVDLLSVRCFISVDLPAPGLPLIQNGGAVDVHSHFGNSVSSIQANEAALGLVAASCSRFAPDPS